MEVVFWLVTYIVIRFNKDLHKDIMEETILNEIDGKEYTLR